jgi:hypothetical protein
MNVFQIFADRRDLGHAMTAVQFERGHLPRGILGQIGFAAVVAFQEIDFLARNFNALFSHEHAHDAWIGPDGIVEFHGVSLCCEWLYVTDVKGRNR